MLLAWGFSLVVMFFQKDLGCSLLFFTLFVVMLWVATQRASYLVVGAMLFASGAFFAWKTFTHVQQRVDIWLDPWDLCFAEGQQICRSQFGLALGGVDGHRARPRAASTASRRCETDFIFAVIGEELGLLGGTLVLVAFLLIVGSGLRIAVSAEHEFDKLLAAGLTALLGFQAFIIIAGVTRLLPLTGVTLPFVSYGGSSLIANYVIAGPAPADLRRHHPTSGRARGPTQPRPRRGRRRERADPPARHRPRASVTSPCS